MRKGVMRRTTSCTLRRPGSARKAAAAVTILDRAGAEGGKSEGSGSWRRRGRGVEGCLTVCRSRAALALSAERGIRAEGLTRGGRARESTGAGRARRGGLRLAPRCACEPAFGSGRPHGARLGTRSRADASSRLALQVHETEVGTTGASTCGKGVEGGGWCWEGRGVRKVIYRPPGAGVGAGASRASTTGWGERPAGDEEVVMREEEVESVQK